MSNTEKNKRIAESIKATREKRLVQRCSVFELKIDYAHLNKSEKEKLKMFFIEAKWLYNAALATEKPYMFDTKVKEVKGLDKDGNEVIRKLDNLPSQLKQSMIEKISSSIKSLSAKKKKGKHKEVGKLKFKGQIESIDLKQYGNTHKIIGKNKVKVQGIKRPMRVFGLQQISEKHEIANAKLIKKASGYYIKLTTYRYIEPKEVSNRQEKNDIGIDYGIKTTLTTSDGEKFDIVMQEHDRLKNLQRKLARQKRGSKQYKQTQYKIQVEYEKLSNRKNDAANKIVHHLLTEYKTVYMQDENLKGWHSSKIRGFGKRVQSSVLGRIKRKLKESPNVVVIPRHFPTTKLCHKCGTLNKVSLANREYICECGYREDRDVKAAATILHVGQCKTTYIPSEQRNTSVEGCKTQQFSGIEEQSR